MKKHHLFYRKWLVLSLPMEAKDIKIQERKMFILRLDLSKVSFTGYISLVYTLKS